MIKDAGSVTLPNTSIISPNSETGKKEPEGAVIDTNDSFSLAGSKDDSTAMYALKNFGKAALMLGRGALYVGKEIGKGIGVGAYRFAKGFCKGVGKAGDVLYGKLAGLVGISAIPAGATAAVSASSLGAGPIGIAIAGAAGLMWFHTGGGVIYGLKEMVAPGK